MQGRRLQSAWKVGAGLAAAAVVLAACGSAKGGSTSPPAANSTTATTMPKHIQHGGTAYIAEGASAAPNWIFPFASLKYFSVTNQEQFQYLMFRPLYWFGQPTNQTPDVDYSLSLAEAPVWSDNDTTVTIPLKGWKYRDGQAVDAQSVIFWLNMMKAEGAANWAGYVSGSNAFPGNIKSYSATSPTALSVTLHLTGAFSTTWYLYNELSQIDPMPEAWDVTSLTGAPGSGGCGVVAANNAAMTGASTTKACDKVWSFDTDNGGTAKPARMAGDEATYGSNPLWQAGTDGPWRLSAFDVSSGEVTFVPNSSYDGPQKPILSKVVLVPFATEDDEFSSLAAGGTGSPDVGTLPAEDTPQKPAGTNPLSPGSNNPRLASNYNLEVTPQWGVNYFAENYDSTLGAGGHAGMVFRQLYIRQALQEGINQPGIISAYDKGYGVPTYGPAPVYPPNNGFASGVEESSASKGGPYPFSVSNAVSLLKANGWDVKPGGTTTCTKAGSAKGDCGAGIPAGTPLTFQEVYASGTPVLTETVQYEVGQWAQMGIKVSLKALPFPQVLGIAVPCLPKVDSACQSWDMANWGGGWIYSPDFEPTGEEIFATGAGSNSGNYNDPTNNAEIIQTNRNSSPAVFTKWENYMAEQLPVIWQPESVGETEVSKSLGGVTPLNSLDTLTPEYWYFLKKS